MSAIYVCAHTLKCFPQKLHQLMFFLFFYLFARINGEITYINHDANQLFCLTNVAAAVDHVIDSQLVACCAIFTFKRPREQSLVVVVPLKCAGYAADKSIVRDLKISVFGSAWVASL